MPALAYNVAYAVNSLYVLTSPGYIVLSHVRNLLVNVNSAVNFILYCAVGQKFRRVFLQTFCRLALQSTLHTGVMADGLSTPGADEHVGGRMMRRSPARRWAGVTSMSMYAIDNGDRSRTPVCRSRDSTNL